MSLYATKGPDGRYVSNGETAILAQIRAAKLVGDDWAAMRILGWTVVRIRIIEEPAQGEEE